jgi:hypothetical protein
VASVYNQDSQNAAAFAALFTAAGIKAGKLTFGNAATTDVLAHGLGAAPDFVILSRELSGVEALTWAADTTDLTVTRTTTTNSEDWSYIVGVLA